LIDFGRLLLALVAIASVRPALGQATNYVVVNASSGLVSIPTNGGSIKTVAANVLNGAAVIVDGGGNFIVPQLIFRVGSKLLRVTPSGAVSTIVQSPSVSYGWHSLAMDSSGNFIIGDNVQHAIFRVTPDGSSLTKVGAYPVLNPNELEDVQVAVDSSGNYILAEDNGPFPKSAHFYKMTPSGALSTITLSGPSLPAFAVGLAIDPGGNYLLLDPSNEAIYRISPTGATTAVSRFSELGPASGLFRNPATGELLVVANTDHKLLKISGDGSTITTIVTDPSLLPSPTGVTMATTPIPPAITSVVNGASFVSGGTISSGSWISLMGTNMAMSSSSRKWNAADIVNGKLPVNLDGTSATVNGKPAVVEFIQPSQINILAPDDAALGPVGVTVVTPAGTSNTVTATYAAFAPGLFPATAPYLVAQHADYSAVSVASPAKPGETVVLWGTGFGPANPPVPAGYVFAGANQLANTVTVTIAGQPATVDFAGIVGAGLVQLNVRIPLSAGNGDAPVVATVGGVSSQASANMIPIH
jgi:uncharacterized protein (TIGR03437 family)